MKLKEKKDLIINLMEEIYDTNINMVHNEDEVYILHKHIKTLQAQNSTKTSTSVESNSSNKYEGNFLSDLNRILVEDPNSLF